MDIKSKLPVIFSVVGSLIVVILDIEFIVDEFKINIVLAFFMIAYIEGLYLYLPYLFANTDRSKAVRFFDIALYGFVFIISVTGASLQASKNFVDTYNTNQNISTVAEESKDDKQFYQNQIVENSKKIAEINKISIEKRTWAERNQMERLSKDNSKYTDLLLSEKPEQKEEPIEHKTWLYRFFDMIKVFFSFTIVILIQWGNARCSNINSKRKAIKETPKKVEPDIQEPEKKKIPQLTQDIPKPEVNRTEQHPLPKSE